MTGGFRSFIDPVAQESFDVSSNSHSPKVVQDRSEKRNSREQLAGRMGRFDAAGTGVFGVGLKVLFVGWL
ncbi:MAG: hypothetical protein E5W04_08355 [Mesorhizobium sp.]|nr:MAG: hypothetical protein E5W04_08355 [Mesorhizobium sp.]